MEIPCCVLADGTRVLALRGLYAGIGLSLGGGNPADGYEATILPDICAVLIDAHQQGKLGKYREHLATRAAILQHGLAPGVWGGVEAPYTTHPRRGLQEQVVPEAHGGCWAPKLREHLAAVLMLMKYSPNWRVFLDRLDKEFPQWGGNYMLPFPDDYEPPAGEAAN